MTYCFLEVFFFCFVAMLMKVLKTKDQFHLTLFCYHIAHYTARSRAAVLSWLSSESGRLRRRSYSCCKASRVSQSLLYQEAKMFSFVSFLERNPGSPSLLTFHSLLVFPALLMICSAYYSIKNMGVYLDCQKNGGDSRNFDNQRCLVDSLYFNNTDDEQNHFFIDNR